MGIYTAALNKFAQSASVNGAIVCMINDKVWQNFTGQVYNVSTAKVCQSRPHCFHFPMFRYSLHTSTRQNIHSHCSNSPVSRPSGNYCFNTPQNKISISITPGSFVTHQTQIVIIAAYSRDNILWEFSGRWKVLRARIDYMMHLFLGETIEPELNSGHNTYTFQSVVHSSLKIATL